MENQITVHFRLSVILEWQPENVYTVTCKELPELITEGRTIDEALDNATDCFISTLELYKEIDKELPESIFVKDKKKNHWYKRRYLPRFNPKSYVSINAYVPPRELAIQSF